MWGKIIGIGLVGITQFSIIIISSIIIFSVIQSFLDIDTSGLVNDQIMMMDADGKLVNANIPALTPEEMDTVYAIESLKAFLPTFLIVMPFLFVGGFLLYASFFAVVGRFWHMLLAGCSTLYEPMEKQRLIIIKCSI